MDIQEISDQIHGGITITPVKHKSDEASHNDNDKHDTTNNKKQSHDKVGHNKLKTKTNLVSGLEMEGGFLASLDEVLKIDQPPVSLQAENNYQNDDQVSINDNDQAQNDTNNYHDDKNTSHKLDNNNNNKTKKTDDNNSNKKDTLVVNGKEKVGVNSKTKSVVNNKEKSAINSIDIKKVKDQIDSHHQNKSEKSTTDDSVIKSLKEAQQDGITSKLEKGQHVKVEVKKTHQNKNQGQSFKVKVATNQKLNAHASHSKVHEKIAENNEEKIVSTVSPTANVASNTTSTNNNLVGGGVSNTSLNNSTIGKVSADAVTGVKGASSKPGAGANNLFSGVNSQKGNLATNNKSRQIQQPRQARKHVHIASTMSKVNVDIAKAAEGGADRININLRPNTMGRIDVQIDMQQKGAVVIVNVEKQATLDMLQADASSLQQALESTGMELQGEMQFNLQENTSGGYDQGHQNHQPPPEEEEDNSLIANGIPTMEALQEVRSANAESRGGVDLVL